MTDTLLGNLADIAMERLREFEQDALVKHPDGFYVAYSGGKDSDVILDLVRRSGVKYTAHHHLTTCDPPELVWHVRKQVDVVIERPPLTMWQLIRKKKMPPRRNARYCCEALKEGGGKDRIVVMGVRWGESPRRSKRKMLESCYRHKSKKFLNIIIEWTTTDVWQYIRQRKIKYCGLYDEGFKRLGCVLCPMTRDVERQMQRWPRIAKAWEKAVKATYQPGKDKRFKFKSAEEYWQWWLDRDAPSRNKDDGQIMMFED
ncbi:MAG TPA: phosphoadenosine phosphosulfate reductase [Marinobacter sp.]|uniref:Phosphoadenosine phosphosulphate reductase domain-containing protein n=1 Tax=marine sediment metagenome TaxID=412755 RepID=A0A0F9LK79_9ZZZZ|nr:phosphoadenosine phosphosulfate reductase [Marinobacter sp.]